MIAEFSERIHSEEFAQTARHPYFPKAFSRNSKLPLPKLIGALLSMRNQSQQAMLDSFFASAHDSCTPVREVTDRAFASARNHLHLPALNSLNDMVVRRADEAALVRRWCGLRMVTGDASVLMPAVRPTDNITSIMCAAATEDADLATRSRKCNRSYAAAYMQRVLPRLALFLGDVLTIIRDAVSSLGANSQRFLPGRSQPRRARHVKPHPSCSY